MAAGFSDDSAERDSLPIRHVQLHRNYRRPGGSMLSPQPPPESAEGHSKELWETIGEIKRYLRQFAFIFCPPQGLFESPIFGTVYNDTTSHGFELTCRLLA